MKDVNVANIRNFAVMGHTGSGKTTLIDALLFKFGVNDRLGSVSAGSSMADYTDEEKGRKITLFSKPFSGVYKNAAGQSNELVFVDTPGYQDFFGQMISASHAVESALITVDAVAGVQVGTRRAWQRCVAESLSRGILITGLDRENASFERTLEAVQAAFGAGCVPVLLPLADKSGVVDVLAVKDGGPMAAQIDEIKNKLVELAAETSDALTEKFLGGEALSPEEFSKGLHGAVLAGRLVPVFVALPLKAMGLTELMDGIVRLFPSPLDKPSKSEDGKTINPAPEAPFCGFVWRTVNDRFVGHLTFVRVLGGTLSANSEVMNITKGQKERIGDLLVLNGRKTETVAKATAGDIVAIAKLKFTAISDTLASSGQTAKCAPITFPKPVMFQAVTAKTQVDEDKIGTALARVCEEDPTLSVDHNRETKEMVLQGLGDVHIDVAVAMMKSRSNVEVVLSTPKVPYRETVTAKGDGHYKHKKQSGGRGQYGEVYLRVAHKPADDPEWFENALVGGSIPHNFVPAVQKGVIEGMLAGPLAGFPVSDIKSTVYDGSYHDVDSSEIAFKIASLRALRDAMAKAKPVLLEPIMTVKITIPEHFMGDITGDLNHRRGRMLGMEAGEGIQILTTEVPQAELFRYAAELRSMTGGQGSFEMEFARYDVVPGSVAQKVIAAAAKDRKPDEDEE